MLTDNGIGKPENVPLKDSGFGTESVNLLVQQSKGQLTIVSSMGNAIRMLFKYTKPQHGKPD